MRTRLICSECAERSGGVGTYFVVTIREDGLYNGQCLNGHNLLIATQTLRYEMLFEIALNAIKDGYNREAVSSFSASVERFFEFSIRVFFRKNKSLQPHIFQEVWKTLSNQSERQLGAYISLCAVSFGEVPFLLPSGMVKFRNDVIHKGVLPNKQKALEFGESAYKVIQSCVQKLRDSCLDEINDELSAHVAQIAEGMGTQHPRLFQVTATALNVIEEIGNGYKPFSQILAAYGIQP
jgi:hypothetical protein